MFGAARLNTLSRYQAASAPATGRTAATITANGNAKISTTTPKFGTGSALLDGNGDYLAITPATAVGTGKFTIEFWVKFSTAPATRSNAAWQMAYSVVGNNNSYVLLWSNYIQLGINGAFGSFALGSTMTTGTWYHIAIVRDADYKIYFNGTDRGAATDDSAWASRSQTHDFCPTGGYWFGNYVNGTTKGVIGNMDEIRISNTARYTENFTPTSTGFVNDADTLLLVHADGTNNATTFPDDNSARTAKTITVVGNAQISTAQSKFGGSAALFDGTGDWIKTAASSDIATAGNFTYEAWIRPSTHHSFWMVSQGTNGVGQNEGAIDIRYSSVDTILTARFIGQTTDCTYNTGTWNGTWKHIALVRNGTSALLFIDGTLRDTQTWAGIAGGAQNIYYGARYNEGGNFNGYQDEIRISNTARYTASFTPSASAFTNDANTLLLVHADGTNGSTTFTDDNA